MYVGVAGRNVELAKRAENQGQQRARSNDGIKHPINLICYSASSDDGKGPWDDQSRYRRLSV